MRLLKAQDIKKSFSYPLLVLSAAVFLVTVLISGCSENTNPEYEKLLDRIAIEDMIVKYYVDMGAGKSHDLAQYYTEDAILDVNSQVSKGHEEIEKLYAGVNESGEAPFSGKMHMLLNNAIIDVNGDTATAWFIWTGVLNYDISKPPRFQEQGREFDKLVKVNGKWYIKERYITADSALPDFWKETYKPRAFR